MSIVLLLMVRKLEMEDCHFFQLVMMGLVCVLQLAKEIGKFVNRLIVGVKNERLSFFTNSNDFFRHVVIGIGLLFSAFQRVLQNSVSWLTIEDLKVEGFFVFNYN